MVQEMASVGRGHGVVRPAAKVWLSPRAAASSERPHKDGTGERATQPGRAKQERRRLVCRASVL